MGQIEHVLEVYPDRIKAAMEQISQASEMRWERVQAALKVSATQGVQAAARMDNRLQQVSDLLALERAEVQRLMADERRALFSEMADEREAFRRLMADERDEMLKLSQALTEQQKQVLETQTRNLLAEGVTRWKEMVIKQVDDIIKRIRIKHYWQVAAGACALALALGGFSWHSGWVSSDRAQAASTWGDLQRWNQDHVQACLDARTPTCNIHMEVPEHPIKPMRHEGFGRSIEVIHIAVITTDNRRCDGCDCCKAVVAGVVMAIHNIRQWIQPFCCDCCGGCDGRSQGCFRPLFVRNNYNPVAFRR